MSFCWSWARGYEARTHGVGHQDRPWLARDRDERRRERRRGADRRGRGVRVRERCLKASKTTLERSSPRVEGDAVAGIAGEWNSVMAPAAWVETRVNRPDGGPLCTRWPPSDQLGLLLGVAYGDRIDGEWCHAHWWVETVDSAIDSNSAGTRVGRVSRQRSPTYRELARSAPLGTLRAGQHRFVELVVDPRHFATLRGRSRCRRERTSWCRLRVISRAGGHMTRTRTDSASRTPLIDSNCHSSLGCLRPRTLRRELRGDGAGDRGRGRSR